MASRSLRRFSACLASLVTRSSFFELGQALDQRADVLAEHLVDLGAGGGGILDGVVQQRRGDGGVVELEVGQDRRDFERMGEIGVAGGALLLAMRLHGVDIGAVEQRLVGVGVVAAHPLDQVVLPHHLRLAPALRFSAVSTACATTLRPRSSGARVRAWFCMRGRSVVERAMTIQAPADADPSAVANLGYHGDSRHATRPAAWFVKMAFAKMKTARTRSGPFDALESLRRSAYSSSSGCSSGGASPSRPLSSSSSVMRSTVTSVSSASTVPPGGADQRHRRRAPARRPRRISAANGRVLPSGPPARWSSRRSRAAPRPGSCRCRGRR